MSITDVNVYVSIIIEKNVWEFYEENDERYRMFAWKKTLKGVLMNDGNIFVTDGRHCYNCDPIKRVIKEITQPPQSFWYRLEDYSSVVLPSGNILVSGGKRIQDPDEIEVCKECAIYNPMTDTWDLNILCMNKYRSNIYSVLLSSKVFVFDNKYDELRNELNPDDLYFDVLDLTSNVWTTHPLLGIQ